MNQPADDPLAPLTATLDAEYGLRPVADLASLFAATSPCCLGPAPGRCLRFGGYLDLRTAMLVYVPPPRSVLGLVYALPDQPKGFVDAAATAVADAVQLRQLVLEEAERLKQRALQVELVLLVPAGTGDAEKNALAREFNHIARHTGYLRLIGINVLAPAERSSIERPALRRAFCWLLRETDKWFRHLGAPAVTQPPLDWQLALTDYRLVGNRRFAFSGGAGRLHLVHGHNGSGKSSLVEALELLLTHHIERLDKGGQSPYYPAIRHRPRNGPPPTDGKAKAELRVGERMMRCCTIGPAGLTFAPADETATLRVHSFRIDQVFMNDLMRADLAGRAQLFLEAFAPSDTALLAEVRAAEQGFDQAWAELPGPLALADPSADRAGKLRWCDEQLAPLIAAEGTPAAERARLLPIAAADLALLAPLWHSLPAQLAELDAAPPSVVASLLSRIDVELVALREALPTMLADLRGALRVMEEFAGWEAVGQVARGVSLQADLQRWLELKALVDLAGKYGDVVATLQLAAERGWTPQPEDAKALPASLPDAGVAALAKKRRAELQQELNDARERLRAWLGERPGGTATGTPAPSRRHVLSQDETLALDRAGAWLPSAASPEPLGRQFAVALASNRAHTLHAAVVGVRDGLAKPIEEARALIAAAERVQQEPHANWVGGEQALVRVRQVADTAKRLLEARGKLSGSFFQQLAAGADDQAAEDTRLTSQRLQAAANELLALMTPARWDYGDVGLRTTVEDGRPALGFSAEGDARADLLLNTAELSAFSLVLFLLLAPRVDNPLRLLILDDPLQNMDEMTVCTLARAMAGLIAIYPPGWSVLALFHGMDDMERIREEAPSAVYHLPWARPLVTEGVVQAIDAVAELGTWQRSPQLLRGLLLDAAKPGATP
ncbi:ATP-binding protein [Bradyrhizobium liaoningense]|uniref:ATP-binding protein n=1 Tax=Bradyrhizobium liaoningense TaxID=43992 RepID=UPI001BA92768|nr:ATP-binding protein [Bradyrhizobium liaoningense]MBR0941569.1 AAA family ATPase [Bradyrhizobium liaoningense]